MGYPFGPPSQVDGCEECNRPSGVTKPWPIYTVRMGGNEVCAKCLTPMHWPRTAASAAGRDRQEET